MGGMGGPTAQPQGACHSSWGVSQRCRNPASRKASLTNHVCPTPLLSTPPSPDPSTLLSAG